MTRTCVIGAGFGGLALAIRLQRAGVETTLIEARDRPGGHAWGWQRQGFTFDSGPASLGDPAELQDLLRLCGDTLTTTPELLTVEPLRRLSWPDGFTLDLPTDFAAMRAEIARIAPEDSIGFEDFQRWATQALLAKNSAASRTSQSRLGKLAKEAPHFVRHQGWRSAYGLVSGFFKSAKLREAFTVQLLLAGANPISASALQVLGQRTEQQHGSWWPKGGMNHCADTLAAQFQKLGGTLLLHDPVLHVHTLGDRASEVECISGWRQRFDAVCSSADVVHSYRDLLAGSQRGPEMARKLVRQKFDPSLFSVYFGLEGSWPGIPHHSVLFGPRYKGLLEDIFDHGVLPRDQLIFLEHPSVTDPSLAPEGKSVFRASIPVANQAKLPIDWDQAGPLIEKRILDEVGRRLIPDLDDRIVTKFHYAPRDYALNFNAWGGNAFGLEQSGRLPWQFHLPSKDAKIRNFYLLRASNGVSGALASAKAVAAQMLDDTREGRS
jgi:phytoene desaturase